MQCTLCKSTEKDDVLHGEFLRKGRVAVHYYCLLLTTVMEQNGDDDEGIRGFLVPDIVDCAKKSEKKKCTYCRGLGANVACCNRKCFRFFHTVCGAKNNARYIFHDTFQSFCHQHIDLPNDTNPHDEEELCTICCDSLGTYHPLKSIRPPCCSSGWFHRLCLARAALSAGYFFKCPLCNNEQTFRRFLTYRNVFIPDRDASWELAPRAFSELERKLDCTAPKCVCPTGRSTNVNQWKMKVCVVCGSKAIHINCNKFYHHRRFTCEDCDHLLHEIQKNKTVGPSNTNEGINGESQEVIDCEALSNNDTDDLQAGHNVIIPQETDEPSTLDVSETSGRRILRSRTKSLSMQRNVLGIIEEETPAQSSSKRQESSPIPSSSTAIDENSNDSRTSIKLKLKFEKEWTCVQSDAPNLSPRKRGHSMYVGNSDKIREEICSTPFLSILLPPLEEPPKKRMRSEPSPSTEPRRRSMRLNKPQYPSIAEEEALENEEQYEKNVDKEFRSNNHLLNESTTYSTLISGDFCEAKTPEADTMETYNEYKNETTNLPKLILRQRSSQELHEYDDRFDDNEKLSLKDNEAQIDEAQQEQTLQDCNTESEDFAETVKICTNEQLIETEEIIEEDPPLITYNNTDESDFESEVIIEDTQNCSDDVDCSKKTDESNTEDNEVIGKDSNVTSDTSTTSTATLHSVITDKKSEQHTTPNENENPVSLKGSLRNRRSFYNYSSDSNESNTSNEMSSVDKYPLQTRQLRARVVKETRRRSQRHIKQSPFKEVPEEKNENLGKSIDTQNKEDATNWSSEKKSSFSSAVSSEEFTSDKSLSTTTLNSFSEATSDYEEMSSKAVNTKGRTKYQSESETFINQPANKKRARSTKLEIQEDKEDSVDELKQDSLEDSAQSLHDGSEENLSDESKENLPDESEVNLTEESVKNSFEDSVSSEKFNKFDSAKSIQEASLDMKIPLSNQIVKQEKKVSVKKSPIIKEESSSVPVSRACQNCSCQKVPVKSSIRTLKITDFFKTVPKTNINKTADISEQMLTEDQNTTGLNNEKEATPESKLHKKEEVRSMSDEFEEEMEDSISSEAVNTTDECKGFTSPETSETKRKKEKNLMDKEVFRENRRRSYRLEKQITPIVTQRLPPVVLTDPGINVLNNRNRVSRKSALFSRIRTSKMCEYFNADD